METNGAKVLEANDGYLLLTDSLVQFSIGYWRESPANYFADAWKDNRLIEGSYTLQLQTSRLSDQNENPDLYIELRNDKGDLLNQRQQVFPMSVSLVSIPFTIDHSHLNINLKAESGSVGIAALSVEKDG
jgi:hypothetical protein